MLSFLPFNKARFYIWQIRRRFFDKPAPSYSEVYVVPDSVSNIQAAFRKQHFLVTWTFSYHYEDEVLNLMRPEYSADEYKYYQTHARGFETDGGVGLVAHYELDPTEYPEEHIDGANFDEERGMIILADVLENAGYEYEIRDRL